MHIREVGILSQHTQSSVGNHVNALAVILSVLTFTYNVITISCSYCKWVGLQEDPCYHMHIPIEIFYILWYLA